MRPGKGGIGGVTVVACPELVPEIVANGAENVECAIVANGPGNNDGECAEDGEDAVAHPRAAGVLQFQHSEQKEKRQE